MPSSRTVLAGFSQGAAIALFTGLRHAAPLAGILAQSGDLPLHESLPAEASEANQQVEILQAHGQHDDVVPYPLGHGSAALLRAAGYHANWHEYPMAHQVCPEEVQEIGRCLTRVPITRRTTVDRPARPSLGEGGLRTLARRPRKEGDCGHWTR